MSDIGTHVQAHSRVNLRFMWGAAGCDVRVGPLHETWEPVSEKFLIQYAWSSRPEFVLENFSKMLIALMRCMQVAQKRHGMATPFKLDILAEICVPPLESMMDQSCFTYDPRKIAKQCTDFLR